MNHPLEKIEKGPKHDYPYAFLSQRFYAGFVDGIIVGLFAIFLSLILSNIVQYYRSDIFLFFSNLMELYENNPFVIKAIFTSIIELSFYIFYIIFCFLIKMIYYSYYLSSSQQATSGMKMHSLRLVDRQGRGVSFVRAFMREIASFFSCWFFLIGYLMVLWTSRRQGFHDMVTSTYVINVQEEQSTNLTQAQQDEKKYYGGFWRRVFASFIDVIICTIPTLLVIVLTGLPVYTLNDVANYYNDIATSYFVAFQLLKLLPVIYHVFFISSKYQATPGKMLLSLKVTDTEGQRLTPFRSLIRYCAKFYSALILGIGYLMVAFTKRRQGLHDKIALTYVVRTTKVKNS